MKSKFVKKKLKNGITVLFEKRDLPVVSLSITNRFGGAYEDSEVKGIAHVMEHMLLAGTESRSSEEIAREVEKKGGVLNAFTAHEVTSYWFKMPSEHLFSGLDILIDSLKNPKFEEKKFEREKGVILEEIKMYHDDPRGHAMEQIEKNLYESPFGDLIIGNAESVSGLKREFIVDYFRKHYASGNFIVTIVGGVEDSVFEKVCKYLEDNFDGEKGDYKIKEIIKKNDETVEEREHLDQAHLVFGVHGPLPGEEDYYALEVMDAYLGKGMSSRLFTEIREKRGLAYAVMSMIDSEKHYCHYIIYVGTMKDKVDEVKKLILQGFKDVDKMTEKDMKEAKEQIMGLRRVKSEEGISVMNELVFSELQGGAEDYYEHEKKIEGVSLKQIKKLARDLIKQGYSTAAVVPK
jgi:predicted Zn-dependent peptidase